MTPSCYGNRQPDSLITRMEEASCQATPLQHIVSTVTPLHPASIVPPLPHVSVMPPTAGAVVGTSSKPHPLTPPDETGSRQPQATEQFLLSQHNNNVPVSQQVLSDSSRKTVNLHRHQDEMATGLQIGQDRASRLNVKLSSLMEQRSPVNQTLANLEAERGSGLEHHTSVGQNKTAEQASLKGEEASETISDSSSKDASDISSVGRGERKVELPQTQLQITDREEMKKDLSLSVLSLSPSPTHTVDLSPTSATPISLSSQPNHSQLEGTSLPPPPLGDLSMDVDSLSVEDNHAAESALRSGRGVKSKKVSSVGAQPPPKRSSSPSQSLQQVVTSASQPDHSTLASQPAPPPTALDENGDISCSLSNSWSDPTSEAIAAHGGSDGGASDGGGDAEMGVLEFEGEDSANLVTNEEVPDSLSANEEDSTNLAANEENPASFVTNEEDPSSLANVEEDPANLVVNEEDPASLAASEELPSGVTVNKEALATSEKNSSSVPTNEGRAKSTSVTVVINLISTLKRHLAEDAESADIMYILPSVSDNMKSQISSSQVLTSNLIK